MSTASLHITKPLLEELYLKQGLSIRECANVIGMPTHGPISWYLKKFDIKARAGKFKKGNKCATINHNWLGRKHTKAARKKMSESAKVKVFTDEHRANLSKAFKKVVKTEEWKKKIGKAHRGHTRQCGHKNSNWQGGIQYEPYCSAWGDEEFREDIRERDNHQCQNPDCWGTGDRICIHHIDYEKRNCHPDNLITLCSSCNVRANYDREWHTAYYNAFMQRSGKTIST